ncbi:Ran guanine nucleotide release factor [Ceratocystis fimbriata CBS 114723]|uniref:Ran guanine nucleotide release factor n=1 Tax=Ceratocystis fimbriata CBS 114723 TaxID=1035309 RepID=A0A2C5XMY2_9PEZI|nr:Ran guanine nucleotide release factor [Ceratocystis fimbriata CBS 114723]
MANYKSTPLYGGAIIVDLPQSYIDVSNIRTVPDHQEVFIDSNGLTSIVFEINERIGDPSSNAEIDGEALEQHLMDLVGEDSKGNIQVWDKKATSFNHLNSKYPCYSLIATDTPPQNDYSNRGPVFTGLIMILLRLENKDTDILITINVPHVKGEYDEFEIDLQAGKQGSKIKQAIQFADQIRETFDIKDYALFGAD